MEGDTNSFIEDRGEYMICSELKLQGLSISFWQRVHVSFTMKRFATKRLYLTRFSVINVRETFVPIRDF